MESLHTKTTKRKRAWLMWIFISAILVTCGSFFHFDQDQSIDQEEFVDRVKTIYGRFTKGVKARGVRAEAIKLLSSSTSLHFVTSGYFLDGGSKDFEFTNQVSKDLFIFLPNPSASERLYEAGWIRQYSRKTQPILIVSKGSFQNDELHEIVPGSSEDKKLKALVHSSEVEILSPGYKYLWKNPRTGEVKDITKEIRINFARFVKAVDTRVFDWPNSD